MRSKGAGSLFRAGRGSRLLSQSELRENRTPGAILLNMLIAAASLFVNGFGIYLTIQANIGAAPWDVLNLGLSKSLGILYGNASIAVSISILFIDILMREPIGIDMFIDAVVVGKAVDFFNWLHIVPPCTSLLTAIPCAASFFSAGSPGAISRRRKLKKLKASSRGIRDTMRLKTYFFTDSIL